MNLNNQEVVLDILNIAIDAGKEILKIYKKIHDRSSLVSKYNDCNSDYWCCLGSLLHIYL